MAAEHPVTLRSVYYRVVSAGAVEKTVNLGSSTLIGPIAVNGTVYVATDEAQLIALR